MFPVMGTRPMKSTQTEIASGKDNVQNLSHFQD
jgi:hypothetical protein